MSLPGLVQQARPPVHVLRHALKGWPALASRLDKAARLWLFTDYDGTLVPIAPTPSQARLSSAMRALLRRLALLPATRVAIVSGRALTDVRRCVRLRQLIYIGNHGLEAAGPGIRFELAEAAQSRDTILRMRTDLTKALRTIPGAWVEYKGLSLSVHWRQVTPAQLPRLHRVFEQVSRSWVKGKGVRLGWGKGVYEVAPAVHWHKGAGIERVLGPTGHREGTELWCLGDDRTDEDAFRAVNRLGGVAICVCSGRRRTAARWYVKDSGQVKQLLERLAAYWDAGKGTRRQKKR